MGYGEFTQIHPCKNITSMFNLYLKLLLCRPRSRTAGGPWESEPSGWPELEKTGAPGTRGV